MIVVDTSAVASIFLQEDDAAAHARCMKADGNPVMSVATLLEASIVVRSFKKLGVEDAEAWLDEFVAITGMRIEPVSLEQSRIARRAHVSFGKGTGHGAALNYGDCFAYALAKSLDVPLLYKGSHFARTDIRSALA